MHPKHSTSPDHNTLARFRSKHTYPANAVECAEWTAGCFSSGYGQFWWNGHTIRSHIFAWIAAGGADPTGQCVCHTCDNPRCVRADDAGVYIVNGTAYLRIGHLFLAPDAINHTDAALKGRAAAGPRHGRHTRPERTARGIRHSSQTHPERVPRGERHMSRTTPEALRRGEAHPHTRVTAEQVRAMRAAFADGATIAELAQQYGMSHGGIYGIVHRMTWRHISA